MLQTYAPLGCLTCAEVMKILIVCPAKTATSTGNVSTAKRIESCFIGESDVECILSDPASIALDLEQCSCRQLNEFVTKNQVSGILFLHAYKAARILICDKLKHASEICSRDIAIPYGIIFGGTDLNLDIHDEEKMPVIRKVLENAGFAVAFNEALKGIAEQISPDTKVFVQPQAVETNEGCMPKRVRNGIRKEDLYVFLMVTGIRPVKDPIYLLEHFIAWSYSNQSKDIKLLILGPILDDKYANKFFARLRSISEDCNDNLLPDKQRRGRLDVIKDWMFSTQLPILYSPPLCSEDLHELMTHPNIFASVNSSQSEGMALSILEAMAAGLPVLARSNPGNSSLVTDGLTGLLFDTPERFVVQAERLMNEKALHETVTEAAFKVVSEKHSIEAERIFYQDVCRNFFYAKTQRNGH